MAEQAAENTPQEITRQLTEVTIDPGVIAKRKQQIDLLQRLTRDLLKKNIDFGRIPGTPQDSLWDPGASTIIAGFNCYAAQRRILSMRDDSERISICVEVPLVSRQTGEVVATGVGAASTMETKYKYRWLSVEDVAELGYTQELLDTMKKRKGNSGEIQYRVPNPEHGELLNTLLKMASKRAEVDAAESLPGVASVLRELFSGKSPMKQQDSVATVWPRFWGEVRRLGLSQAEAYSALKVPSMKDWLGQGKTLEDALDALRKHLIQNLDLQTEEPPSESADQLDQTQEEAPQPMFKNWGEFAAAAMEKGVSPGEVFARAKVKSWADFGDDYWTAWGVVDEIAREKRLGRRD